MPSYTGPDGRDVAEPWAPLEGQTVRLRLSECPLIGNLGYWPEDAGGVRHSACHKSRYNGRQAVIIRTDYPGPSGHRFEALIYGPRTQRVIARGHYCAMELEPLTSEVQYDGHFVSMN